MRTAKAGGIQIAYRITGSGRPLLLINGSGATLDTWDPALLKALTPGHRIIVFDPRGMAGSTDSPRSPLTVEEMADDAAALLRALRIARADVLGWSLGGLVAQELAIRHPKLVRRLILASSSAGGRHAQKATAPVTSVDEKATIGLASPDGFLADSLPKKPAGVGTCLDRSSPRTARRVLRVLHTGRGRRQVAAGRRWYTTSGGDEQRLSRITAPTLIAAGALDVDVPVDNARLLHRRIPGSHLAIYPGAGHAFLIQDAARSAAKVQRFLN